MIRGKIHMAIDRVPYLASGYRAYACIDDGSGLGIVHLGDIKIEKIPETICERKPEHAGEISGESLRTLYESFREEMIKHGLIPRPLVEDEVKTLRAQLADTQKTRDQLLEAMKNQADAFIMANTTKVWLRESGT